jgi:endoglucanase
MQTTRLLVARASRPRLLKRGRDARATSRPRRLAFVWFTLVIAISSLPTCADNFLHTSGQDILDSNNQKIILRGVGLGNWLLPEGYMWHFGERADRPRRIEALVSDLAGEEYAAKFWTQYRANYITEKDIHRIAELGFNSVRPALNARLFLTETDPSEYRDEGFQILDNLITWCRANHIYVIIDMHAAPGGQTGANIDDSIGDQPLLFIDPKYEKRLTDLWVKIATKYKDDPAVAAYDLLNEPIPERTGAAAKYKDRLEALYKRLTAAIRAVDQNHIITVEGYDWANNWSCFTAPPFDKNLVYQFHYYCWDKPTKLKSIDQYLKHRDRLGAPVWVGETGEKDNAIYFATTDYFESNNIGWSFWPWKKIDNANAPYSYKSPEGWRTISAWSRNPTTRPSRESARKIFDELLQNIRLENCTYNAEVVNALFHRLPLTIEAENFGQRGAGVSYSVHDPAAKSQFYRTSEPVRIEPVEPANSAGPRAAGQAIRLDADEWTAYEIQSAEAHTYHVTIHVKPDRGAATVTLTVNGVAHESAATAQDWIDLSLGEIPFARGPNMVKLSTTGALIDWISIRN